MKGKQDEYDCDRRDGGDASFRTAALAMQRQLGISPSGGLGFLLLVLVALTLLGRQGSLVAEKS